MMERGTRVRPRGGKHVNFVASKVLLEVALSGDEVVLKVLGDAEEVKVDE
jgi:hypothetical protein